MSFSRQLIPHSPACALLSYQRPMSWYLPSPTGFQHHCNLTSQLSLSTLGLQCTLEKKDRSVRECHSDPQLGPQWYLRSWFYKPLSGPMDSQSTDVSAICNVTTPNLSADQHHCSQALLAFCHWPIHTFKYCDLHFFSLKIPHNIFIPIPCQKWENMETRD